MKRLSRKQLRFIAFLVLMWSWNVHLVSAQSFEPLTPTETLIQEISDGTASIAQFEELAAFAAQQRLTDDITNLLGQESTENYFNQNFNPDGAYGQMENGLVVEDWETLAKGMGTTGAILAGAYAVWRSRRRDYLGKIRAGDEALIEEMFEQEFGATIEAGGDLIAPNGTAAWAAWASSKNIPGTGTLLYALFAVWKRRKEMAVEETRNETNQYDGYRNRLEDYWKQFTRGENIDANDDFVAPVIESIQEDIEAEFQTELNATYTNPGAPEDHAAVLAYQKAVTDLANAQQELPTLKARMNYINSRTYSLQRTVNSYQSTQTHYKKYLDIASENYDRAFAQKSPIEVEFLALQAEKERHESTLENIPQAQINTLSSNYSRAYSQLNSKAAQFRNNAYYAARDAQQIDNLIRSKKSQITNYQRQMASAVNTYASYDRTIAVYKSYQLRYPRNAAAYQRTIDAYQGYKANYKARMDEYEQVKIPQLESEITTLEAQKSQAEIIKTQGTTLQQNLDTFRRALGASYSARFQVNNQQQAALNYRRQIEYYEQLKKTNPRYAYSYQRTINTYKIYLANAKTQLATAKTNLALKVSDFESALNTIKTGDFSALENNSRFDGSLSTWISDAETQFQDFKTAGDDWLDTSMQRKAAELSILENQAALAKKEAQLKAVAAQVTVYQNQKNNYQNYVNRYQGYLDTYGTELNNLNAEKTAKSNTIAAHQAALASSPAIRDQNKAAYDQYMAEVDTYERNKSTLWSQFTDKFSKLKTQTQNFLNYKKEVEAEAFLESVYPAGSVKWGMVQKEQFSTDVRKLINQTVDRKLEDSLAERGIVNIERKNYTEFVELSDLPPVATNQHVKLQNLVSEARELNREHLLNVAQRQTQGYRNQPNNPAQSLVLNYLNKNYRSLGWPWSPGTKSFGRWRSAQYNKLMSQLGTDQVQADLQKATTAYKAHEAARKSRDREIKLIRNDIQARYNHIRSGSAMLNFLYEKRRQVVNQRNWDQSISQFADKTTQAQTDLGLQADGEIKQHFDILLKSFSTTEIQALLSQEVVYEPSPEFDTPMSDKQAELEATIAALEVDRKEPSKMSQYLRSQGHTNLYYQSTGHNRGWKSLQTDSRGRKYWAKLRYGVSTQLRDKYYASIDQKIERARDELAEYKVGHDRQRIIQLYTTETDQNSTEPLNVLKQTLQWFSGQADNAQVQTAYKAMEQVRDLNPKIQDLEQRIKYDDLHWSEKEVLKLELTALNEQKETALDRINDTRKLFLFTPGEAIAQTKQSAQMGQQDAKAGLEENAVHQWLEAQKSDREFMELYGINNREEYLAQRIADLEKRLKPLTKPTQDVYKYNGYKWTNGAHLQRDLVKLKNGIIPDYAWSTTFSGNEYLWYRTLPFRGDRALQELYYRKNNTVNSRVREEAAAAITAREAELKISRGATWEATQTETLESKFSAEEIAAYQALMAQVADNQEKEAVLTEAETIVQNTFRQSVQTSNIAYQESKKSPAENLVPFTADEFEQVSLQADGSALVPDYLKEVYFEAYRRFQDDQGAFADEVERLSGQAKAIERQERIAKAGIPREPAADKQVIDYIRDDARTMADLNREIAEKRAAIPILKEKYAGQAYLKTALEQTDKHIAALIRYRDGSAAAAQQYLARKEEYEVTYKPQLANIDQYLTAKYERDNITQFVASYFPAAANLLAKRMEENQYTPTNPNNVELVEQYDSSEAIAAYLESLKDGDSLNTAFNASRETALDEAKDEATRIGEWWHGLEDPTLQERLQHLFAHGENGSELGAALGDEGAGKFGAIAGERSAENYINQLDNITAENIDELIETGVQTAVNDAVAKAKSLNENLGREVYDLAIVSASAENAVRNNSFAGLDGWTAGPTTTVENSYNNIALVRGASLSEIGLAFLKGVKKQLINELKGLKALLDWRTYAALLKAVPKLLGALWDMSVGLVKHGPDFMNRLGDELASIFGGDVAAIKAKFGEVKTFAAAAIAGTATTTMAEGAGVAGTAVTVQVVPVGKITKAADIAPLANKFSGAVDNVIAKYAGAIKILPKMNVAGLKSYSPGINPKTGVNYVKEDIAQWGPKLRYELDDMIAAGVAKEGFYKGSNIDELVEAITIFKKGDIGANRRELMYVVSNSGEILLQPRGDRFSFAHTGFLKGDGVLSAGLINVDGVPGNYTLRINNQSGHYAINKLDLYDPDGINRNTILQRMADHLSQHDGITAGIDKNGLKP